jgi:hypothetical protein
MGAPRAAALRSSSLIKKNKKKHDGLLTDIVRAAAKFVLQATKERLGAT